MKKKILIGLLISSLFITNANAWFPLPKTKTVVVVGGAVYGAYLLNKSIKETIEYFKEHPLEAPDYFNKYPEKYESFKKALLKILSKENNPNLYEAYKQLAEVMGISNIPGFNPQINNFPVVHQNPIQNQNGNGFIYDNPIQQIDNSNIIVDPINPEHKVDTSTEFPIERPQSWEDYLLLLQNSTILGNNLDDWYKTSDKSWSRPDDVAAHHLIPAKDKAAQDARDILAKYGIDINDAINGVYLPTLPTSSKNKNTNNNVITGIEHNGRHPKSYIEKVNKLITDADTRGGKQ